MKWILAIIITIISFALTTYFVRKIFVEGYSYNKILSTVTDSINKQCPVMIDQDTRLDSVVALSGNVVQYNYTLVNMNRNDPKKDGIKDNVEPVIINMVKTNDGMKMFRDNKTTIDYNYNDRNGNFFFSIDVTPDKYLQK